jgi:hypothetical protein
MPDDEPSSTPARPPTLPGLVIQRAIGSGGFATVWEGRRRADGVAVAIKISQTGEPMIIERFRREAAALRLIGPPHVPVLFEDGQLPDGRPYLVMERLYGSSLGGDLELLEEPPPPARVGELMEAILSALAAAHEHGIVHRDLKPENIFLTSSLPVAVRLLDFGLTRSTQLRVDEPVLTRAGTIIGTPEYMAPEQLDGASSVDVRADIYAAGIILFELLTLRVPFVGSRAEIEHGHRALRPPRPSDLGGPAAFDAVVARCLAKEREGRYSTVAELRQALGDAISVSLAGAASAPATTPTPSPTPTPAPVEPRGPRKRAAEMRSLATAEKQQVALLFLDAAEGDAVTGTLQQFQGHLAHISGSSCAWAFVQIGGDHPVRRALAAARQLVERRLVRSVVVDVASMSIRSRPDGTPRFLSPALQQKQRLPAPSDPEGVLLSAIAHELLPFVPCSPIGDGRRFAAVEEPPSPDVAHTAIQEAGPPLVGRDAVLASLIASARSAFTERQPTLTTILADPGFGKSHLCVTLLRDLKRLLPDAEILSLRAREPVDGDSEATLQEMLRRTLELPGAPEPEEGRRLLVDRLGPEMGEQLYGSVALILGWIPPQDPSVRALVATPGVLRQMATTAVGEGLRRLALRGPLCLILDDAHWADQATLDALEYATLDEQPVPLWVCVLARPHLETVRSGWGTRAAARHLERLGPLGRKSAADLCRELLRPVENIPEPAIERLVERTRGVPLLLVELLKGLKRDGFVREQKGRGGWYLATEALDELPDLPLVQWLASREVASLPVAQAQYAQLACLLAAEFRVEELEGVIAHLERQGGGDEFTLDARFALRHLQQSSLLVTHRDGSIGFRHALVREAIAQSIDASAQARIHRAALEYYRTDTQLPDSARLARLAQHAACAGERAEAATAFMKLGDAARVRHAYLEADLLYGRALQHFGEDQIVERFTALKRRGDTRYRVNRYDDSLADFSQARQLVEQLGRQAALVDVLLDEALALDWMQEFAQSQAIIERAEQLARAQPLESDASTDAIPLIKTRLVMMRGVVAWRYGKPMESIALCEEAAAQAAELGDEGYEVLLGALFPLACLYPAVNRLDDAQAVFDRLTALCQARRDERHMGAILVNRTYLWIALNQRARLEADLRDIAALSRRLACMPLEEHAQHSMASYLYWLGEFDAAEPHVRRLIELEEAHLGEGTRPQGRLLQARLAWMRGDHTTARQVLDEIREQQRWAREAGKIVALLLPAEQILLEMLELALREATPAEWDELLERADTVVVGQELIEMYEIRGLVADRSSDTEAARRAWTAALSACERVPFPAVGRIEKNFERIKAQA